MKICHVVGGFNALHSLLTLSPSCNNLTVRHLLTEECKISTPDIFQCMNIMGLGNAVETKGFLLQNMKYRKEAPICYQCTRGEGTRLRELARRVYDEQYRWRSGSASDYKYRELHLFISIVHHIFPSHVRSRLASLGYGPIAWSVPYVASSLLFEYCHSWCENVNACR